MTKNSVLELAQRTAIAGRPTDDRVTISVDLYNRAMRLALEDSFSEDWYLSEYPDVKEALDKGIVSSALDHYVSAGLYEGRFPFELEVDEESYFQTHPDVEEAVIEEKFSSALQHFKTVGYAEGRRFALTKPKPTKSGRKVSAK
ncbi:MAG: hypothetical protein ABJQ23_20845 [Shimia thalassica]|uniref:hypothetical protein n=1 Tax=Shimia thalassica TaxID=1715693 RepID=UPI003296C113